MNKKWIAYSVTGAVGLAVLAGGATAAAASMQLRTSDGTVIDGGSITGRDGTSPAGGTLDLRATDPSLTVVSPPSPVPVSTQSIASAPSAPAPAPAAPEPVAPAPAPPAPVDSPASVPSAATTWSAGSVASAGSN